MLLTREERRRETRANLVAAAERLFCERGFHATSLDAVAEAAGYTKGAVYSNFSSKEDLFFAVYEQRVTRRVGELRGLLGRAASVAEGMRAGVATTDRRTGDGWMAVFFEFWAHVLRRPEHRERFATLHRAALGPFVETLEAYVAERGVELPLPAPAFASAYVAMGNGLQLERLTRPEEIDADTIERLLWVLVEDLDRRGREQ